MAAESVGKSLVINGTVIELDGDEESPGNNKLYSTNASGVKGWSDGTASVSIKNSIENDADALQLVGDEDTPGNNKVYGTNDSGNKGWQDSSSSVDIDDTTIVDGDDSVEILDVPTATGAIVTITIKELYQNHTGYSAILLGDATDYLTAGYIGMISHPTSDRGWNVADGDFGAESAAKFGRTFATTNNFISGVIRLTFDYDLDVCFIEFHGVMDNGNHWKQTCTGHVDLAGKTIDRLKILHSAAGSSKYISGRIITRA